MNNLDILPLRLQNHHLTGPKFKTPHEAVSYLCAVQAQDYAAAKSALGLRVENATDEMMDKAFNEGKILRTHVMRPTWHFVTPEDIVWMQELTAARVHAQSAYMYRKADLDEKMFGRCHEVLADVLKNHNYLTREELRAELEKKNIVTRGHPQFMAYVLIHAELAALICSGPRKGKQFSYALVSERAPKAKKLSREEALSKLALTYFMSHGPAQIKDFVWWSSIPTKDVQVTLDLLKSKLVSETINGKTYWYSPYSTITSDPTPKAFLLSIFDEYTIAYKDRTDISAERHIERMIMMGNALLSVIILDGKVVGSWKRVLTKKDVQITFTLFQKLNPAENEALQKAANDYGEFHQLPVTIT